ncbi:hypothetical protein [Actinomadura alba]|uniref:Uncharacterized protein n=1 Tax=Actinomadura alba TaxID=406431 RepID=A0ABR7LR02_9ACTN|nr:hypothetical protein [Actinomadura alba]MBC6467272.1 hypothetical protein [Actinomadura alba]
MLPDVHGWSFRQAQGPPLPGIQGIYSHVTATMRERLTAKLQRQWAALNRQRPRP